IKPVVQPCQGGVCPLQMPGGTEERPGVLFSFVFETGRETIELVRLFKLPFRPQNVRVDSETVRVDLTKSQSAPDHAPGRAHFTRVRAELQSVLLPKKRVGLFGSADLLQISEAF